MKFVVEHKSPVDALWQPEENFNSLEEAVEYASRQAYEYTNTAHRVVAYNVPNVVATFEPMRDFV